MTIPATWPEKALKNYILVKWQDPLPFEHKLFTNGFLINNEGLQL